MPAQAPVSKIRRYVALVGATHSAFELAVLPSGFAWGEAFRGAGGAPSFLLDAALSGFIGLHAALVAGFLYSAFARQR